MGTYIKVLAIIIAMAFMASCAQTGEIVNSVKIDTIYDVEDDAMFNSYDWSSRLGDSVDSYRELILPEIWNVVGVVYYTEPDSYYVIYEIGDILDIDGPQDLMVRIPRVMVSGVLEAISKGDLYGEDEPLMWIEITYTLGYTHAEFIPFD